MKKVNFIKSMGLLMVGAVLTLGSCSKDNENGGKDLIELKKVGYHIKGSATSDMDLMIDAKQVVEPSSNYDTKVEREGMMYGIHYLTAGTFKFTEVTDTEETTLGVSAVTEVTQDGETEESFTYKAGSFTSGENEAYTVATEGLYYIILDQKTSKFWVMQIKNIEIKSTGDKAELVSGNKDAVKFEIKGTSYKAGSKFRINTAWKLVFEDVMWEAGDAADFDGDHVRPVISYGGSVDNLDAKGGDIEISNGGKLLDFAFNWKSGEKGVAGLTITTLEGEELPKTDWSKITLQTIGAGVSPDNTDAITDPTWGWGNVIDKDATKSGDVYTYTWDKVKFVAGEEWRIVDIERMKNINYTHLDAASSTDKVIDSNPENGDRNMKFEAEGTYKIVIVIDSADGDKTVMTITEI